MNRTCFICAFTFMAAAKVVFGQGFQLRPSAANGPAAVNLSPSYHRGSTFHGDVLRGAGALQHGLGAHDWGVGQYCIGLGNYLVLQELATSQSIQNKQTAYELRKRVAEEHAHEHAKAMLARRTEKHRASIVKHRDRPDIADILSGEAINFLLDELRDYASLAEFSAEPGLIPDEFDAVRLRTANGISVKRWNELIDESGSPIWLSRCPSHDLLPLQQRAAECLAEGVRYARAGQCWPKDQAMSIQRDLWRYRDELAVRRRATTSSSDLESVQFFRDLDIVCRALSSGEAVSEFNGILTPATRSPKDLLSHVVCHQLRFDPAHMQALPLYRSIHESLAKLHRDQMDSVNVTANR